MHKMNANKCCEHEFSMRAYIDLPIHLFMCDV